MARPCLSDLQQSPHYPLLVTGNDRARGQVLQGSTDPMTQVNINGPGSPFETDLFKGRMAVHFRGLPTSDAEVFAGKRRTVHTVIQGRFKRSVAADDLMWGQEFFFAQDNPPLIHGLLARAVLKAAAAISSSRAHIQILNVSRDGAEPALMDTHEDARLLSPLLSDKAGLPLPAHKRRKLMDNPAFTKALVLGTEHVYTFVGWFHHVNWERFEVDLAGFLAFDLCRWLPRGVPTLVMAKDIKTGCYLVNLSCWHKRIVELAEAREQAQKKQSTTDAT